jgi:hypothetical protein
MPKVICDHVAPIGACSVCPHGKPHDYVDARRMDATPCSIPECGKLRKGYFVMVACLPCDDEGTIL